jgi:predicted PurR-regulated permease PerM
MAATFTLTLFLVVLLIPLVLFGWFVVNKVSDLLDQLAGGELEAGLAQWTESLEGLPLAESVQTAQAQVAGGAMDLIDDAARAVAGFVADLGSSVAAFVVQGLLFVVLVAALLPAYDILLEKTLRISPLGYDIARLYSVKITAMIVSLVLGVFVIALLEGLVMGVFYWLAGLPFVFGLTLLSIALSLLPVVGVGWMAWVVAILLALQGNFGSAALVLLGFYGAAMWIEILLRPLLLKKEAHLHFALFLLAMFGGIVWAGMMGLFYGPVILLLLVTTIQIYGEQFAKEDGELLRETLEDRLGTGGESVQDVTLHVDARRV